MVWVCCIRAEALQSQRSPVPHSGGEFHSNHSTLAARAARRCRDHPGKPRQGLVSLRCGSRGSVPKADNSFVDSLEILAKNFDMVVDAKEEPMLTRIMAMLMAATLAAAAPALAQGANNTNPRTLFGNFGPTSDAIGRANPGNQARTRPTDPNQIRSLPGFVAPSQSQPNAPRLPDSDDTGQTPGR